MAPLPRTSAPAERALLAAGYDSLESLAGVAESDLLALHGVGRLAIDRIRAALLSSGLAGLS
jgi:hypothetical protein